MMSDGSEPDNTFLYFKSIIPVMVFEYLIVVFIFLYYRKCCCKCCKSVVQNEMDITSYDEVTGTLSDPSQVTLKFHRQFEDTYESYSPPIKYVLFMTRLLSLGYVCGISVSANYATNGRNQWYYFAMWNAELISIYFFLGVGCSILGFIYGNNSVSNACVVKMTNESSTRIVWSSEINRFAHLIHILLEVCGGNSLIIMAVAFVVLDQKFEFWNISMNFVPALTMLVELFLNNIYVRFDHFPLNLTWPALYLIFLWPAVYYGDFEQFPYFFLQTDTRYCFPYYTALLLLNFLFFYIWYGFSELKFSLRTRWQRSSSTFKSKTHEFSVMDTSETVLLFMIVQTT